jgi:hypothetical protein
MAWWLKPGRLTRAGRSGLTRGGKRLLSAVKRSASDFVNAGTVRQTVTEALSDKKIFKIGTSGDDLVVGTPGYTRRLEAKTTKNGVAQHMVDEMDNGVHLLDDTERLAMKADMKKVLIDDHGMSDDAATEWVDDVFKQADEISHTQFNDALKLKGYTVADDSLRKTFGLSDATKGTIGKWTIRGTGFIVGGYLVYWGINTFTGVLDAFGDALADEAALFVSEHPIIASGIGIAIVALPVILLLSMMPKRKKKKDDTEDKE